jgi:hypothetical protein
MIAVAATSVLAAGCSGGGGILNNPTGAITLTDATTGQTINSSLANPYIIPVPILRFSINLLEPHFAGPYQTKIVFQQNLPTALNGGVPYAFFYNVPCFVITQKANQTTQTVTLTFSGDNTTNGQPYANPPATPTPTPLASGATPGPAPSSSPFTGTPCHSGELEQALIDDGHGHVVNFYYEEQ